MKCTSRASPCRGGLCRGTGYQFERSQMRLPNKIGSILVVLNEQGEKGSSSKFPQIHPKKLQSPALDQS